jgi:hypothetical protein
MPELIYRNEVERLKQFKKELEYLQSHYQEINNKHNNEFIAIKDEDIIAYDSDSRLLEKKLHKLNVNLRQVLIRYIGKMK